MVARRAEELQQEDVTPSVKAVSYTHLDEYKNQVQNTSILKINIQQTSTLHKLISVLKKLMSTCQIIL